MPGICKGVLIVFAIVWLIAIFLLLIGTFGWFGQEKDPLSGVFLLPLGLPWNQFMGGLPEAARVWGVVLAPAINLVILRVVCALVSRR